MSLCDFNFESNLMLCMRVEDLKPVIIDDSQPLGDEETDPMNETAQRKLFRERSPKEKYFDQITSGRQGVKCELNEIY